MTMAYALSRAFILQEDANRAQRIKLENILQDILPNRKLMIRNIPKKDSQRRTAKGRSLTETGLLSHTSCPP